MTGLTQRNTAVICRQVFVAKHIKAPTAQPFAKLIVQEAVLHNAT
jgi:hypothetical protein